MHAIKKTKVLLAHRIPLVCAGLAAILQHQSLFEVEVSQLNPGETMIAGCIRQQGTNVLVTDFEDGLLAAAQLRDHPAPDDSVKPRVLIVTQHDHECEIRQALEQGVHGYVLLACPLHEVVAAVEAVRRGVRHLGPVAAQRLAESLTREPLTTREMDVLRLLATGIGNKTIGCKLNIAVGTVKSHVKSILAKLDAGSRTEAMAVAQQRGLVPLETAHAEA